MTHRQLTFGSGEHNLFLHPVYGARTLANIAYMTALASRPIVKPVVDGAWHHCSPEMAARTERCIELHGCSDVLW